METQWTGIPVFTRLSAQALLRHGGMEVEFAFQLTRIPEAEVLAAIRAGTGALLRERFESDASAWGRSLDRDGALLYPSVKDAFGLAAREASTVHDISTLVMPEFHEDAMWRTIGPDGGGVGDRRTPCSVFRRPPRRRWQRRFPCCGAPAVPVSKYVDWPEHFALLERNLPALGLGPYAVVIGTIEPRKNLWLLLKALEMPELRRSRLRFVVIGRRGWKVDKFMASVSPEARERVLFWGLCRSSPNTG